MTCGFSTFAGLHPLHFVLAGGPGTHTVCVCVTHQKLMLRASEIENTQEELLAKTVRSLVNEVCMLRIYLDCLDMVYIEERLKNLLQEADNSLGFKLQQWAQCWLWTLAWYGPLMSRKASSLDELLTSVAKRSQSFLIVALRGACASRRLVCSDTTDPS
ncbi:hypothetical protein HPB51_003093 [Rhipicephalus microplus]|uniref:Uncharacterized protein n=1 Tax=Rhipicephalus microplus TaxID=6941 RepID=A0A9J6DF06_RHIMP|nr:hypothetical protein HPB51_003093 [Rhipicephalus microplus]